MYTEDPDQSKKKKKNHLLAISLSLPPPSVGDQKVGGQRNEAHISGDERKAISIIEEAWRVKNMSTVISRLALPPCDEISIAGS